MRLKGKRTNLTEPQGSCKFGEKSSLTFNIEIETIFFLIEPPFVWGRDWLRAERSGTEAVEDGQRPMSWERNLAERCSVVSTTFHSLPVLLSSCWLGILGISCQEQPWSLRDIGITDWLKEGTRTLRNEESNPRELFPWVLFSKNPQAHVWPHNLQHAFIVPTWQRKVQERPTSRHSSSHHATPWSRVLPIVCLLMEEFKLRNRRG